LFDHEDPTLNTDPDPPVPAVGQDPPKDDKGDDAKAIREELRSLRARVTEAETDSRFWREQAKSPAAAAAKDEEPEEDDVKIDGDLVDIISSGDAKLIRDTFKKMGFVGKAEVDAAIKRTREEIGQKSQMFREYPDLENPKSDFFKETDREYRALSEKYPRLVGTDELIAMAADRVKARSASSSDEDEDERAERIERQSGDRSRKQNGKEKDNQLNKSQMSIVDRFRAAGSKVSVEGYQKRASAGVRLGLGNALGRKAA
jgi:hypothetical protein